MKSVNLNFEILNGIPEVHRAVAAQLYDEAFGRKLSLAIPDSAKRIRLFEKHFELSYAMAAVGNGELMGIAGFSTSDGSLTSGIDYKSLLSDLGLLGGNRAALVLSLYERKAEIGELLMDGIAVDSDYRGLGVGTKLLSQLIEFAAHEQYTSVRLDVIDINTGARKLYEKIGFTSAKTEEFKFLRGVLGFGASTTMVYNVKGN